MKYGKEMTKVNDKFEAECDARTLMDADKIRKDEKRHESAQKAVGDLLKKNAAEAESLKAVAHGEVSYPAMTDKKD